MSRNTNMNTNENTQYMNNNDDNLHNNDVAEEEPEELFDNNSNDNDGLPRIVRDLMNGDVEPDVIVQQDDVDENKIMYGKEPVFDNNSKYVKCNEAIDAAVDGFSYSMCDWQCNSKVIDILDKNAQRMEKLHYIIESIDNAINDREALCDNYINKRTDYRWIIITVGILMRAFHDGHLLNVDDMRDWQIELLVDVVYNFALIATKKLLKIPAHDPRNMHNMEANPDNALPYPWFIESPVLMKPTGAGKSFTGLVVAFFSMIRTDGTTFKLLSPRGGCAVWCVPTKALVEDVATKFFNIVDSQYFALLAPANIANIPKNYITKGYGATSPDMKNKMFAIMTYEYARSGLFNLPINDLGDMKSLRLPFILTLRAVIVDEAHYIVSTEDRAKVVDNIIAACGALCVPMLLLTATPPQKFIDFVVENFNISSNMLTCENAKKKYKVRRAAFPVSDKAMMVDKRSFFDVNYCSNHSDITCRVNKYVAFRCFSATFENDTTHSILFIQSTQQVQVLAAYMTGMYIAMICRGLPSNVCDLMQKLDEEYERIHRDFEGCYKLTKTSKDELASALLQGIADVSQRQCAVSALLHTRKSMSAPYKNFISFLFVKYKIIPYYANCAVSDNAKKVLNNALFSSSDGYRIIVTTSATLEGVTIRDADNLFITPQGFCNLTHTQYTQLCGRVGRSRDGYVETWYQQEFDVEHNAMVPLKFSDTREKEVKEQRNNRLVETDELIDRILFNIGLVNNFSNNAAFNKYVDRISKNTIRNNYYRGGIKLRLCSFYMPASITENIYNYELGIKDIQNNEYDDYLAAFVSVRYKTFFKLYSKLTFESVTPHITLTAITFILQVRNNIAAFNELSIMTDESIANNINALFFMPLLSKYTFAFDPNKCDFASITAQSLIACNDIMKMKVNKTSSITNANVLVTSIMNKVMPEIIVDNALIQNVDECVSAFCVALFDSPDTWSNVCGMNNCTFLTGASVVASYINVVLNINRLRIFQDTTGFIPARALSGIMTLKNHMTSLLGNVKRLIEATVNNPMEMANALRNIDEPIQYTYQVDNSTVELNLSYREYAFRATGNASFLENNDYDKGTKGELDVFQQFLINVPSNIFNY